jgi:hypothetical protein
VLVSVLRSAARRRLVKTKCPSEGAIVNWKMCKSAIVLHLSESKIIYNQGANKSSPPN